jgi:hypothetical protein
MSFQIGSKYRPFPWKYYQMIVRQYSQFNMTANGQESRIQIIQVASNESFDWSDKWRLCQLFCLISSGIQDLLIIILSIYLTSFWCKLKEMRRYAMRWDDMRWDEMNEWFENGLNWKRWNWIQFRHSSSIVWEKSIASSETIQE